MTKVLCPRCKRETGFSRFLSVTAGDKGVFQRIACEHCLAILVVRTRDANGREVVPKAI